MTEAGSRAPRPVRVIADDLTGAADAGATLVGGEREVLLTLGLGGGYWRDPAVPAVTTDTATRDASAAEAAAAVAALAADLPEGTELVNKVDSALRGHIAPEVAALREVLPDHLVVLAPAFPRNQRVTRGGVQHVGGVPIHLGDLWALEAATPPESIANLLAPMACQPIHLDVVRGTLGGLRRSLEAALGGGRVAICDAETDGDLDRLVAAVRAEAFPVVWVGAAGLAAAVGRARRAEGEPTPGPTDVVRGERPVAEPCDAAPHRSTPPRSTPPRSTPPRSTPPCSTPHLSTLPRSNLRRRGPYLAVIGSAAPAAHAQAAVLVGEGRAAPIELPAAALAAGAPETLVALGDRVRSAVAEGDTVVTVSGPLEVERAPAIARSLAAVTGQAARVAAALVLTGGATARAVLEAAGTTALHLVEELDPGIVLARPVGRAAVPVITKSGAFGDDRTLLRAVQRVTAEEGSTPRAS